MGMQAPLYPDIGQMGQQQMHPGMMQHQMHPGMMQQQMHPGMMQQLQPGVHHGQMPMMQAAPGMLVQHEPSVRAYPQNIRDWSSSLFNCSDDIGICCLGWFLPCIQECGSAQRLDENCCCVVCCGGAGYCCPWGSVALRVKYRAMHGIRGSICKDYFSTCACYSCAVCQLARELKAHPK